jgi:spore coat protein U-like protein
LAGTAAPALADDHCDVSAVAVAFGNYDSIGAAARDGVGSVTVFCNNNVTAPTVALGAGNSGNYAQRAMRNGAIDLGYNLYTSAAHNIVWGDGASGTAPVTLGGGIVAHGDVTFTRTIYGRIPALQHVPAGSYADTITVTVTF